MKAGVEVCFNRVGAVLRREQMIWWTAGCGLLLVAILGEFWSSLFPDFTSSFFLVIASAGVFKTNISTAQLYGAIDDQEPQHDIPEQALLNHLQGVLRLGLTMLNARCAVATLWDKCTGQRVDWNLQGAGACPVLVDARPKLCLRSATSEFGSAIYVREEPEILCMGMNQGGQPIRTSRLRKQLNALWRGPFETLLLGHLDVGARWHVAVAYVDAPVPCCLEMGLNRLQQVVSVAGSGYEVFQSASESARLHERQKLARDLHDGVTQSLIATELQIANLGRQKHAIAEVNQDVLEKVRETLRLETRKMRAQIEDLQRGESGSSLNILIKRLIEEFESQTKIRTILDSEPLDGLVPPGLAFELMQILREVLSNVRKHSGAKRAEIRLFLQEGVHLEAQDDGHGFNFTGRYELAELQRMVQRPRTICDRVRENGGDLAIESAPHSGVKLEIYLPFLLHNKETKVKPISLLQRSNAESRRGFLRKPPRSAESSGYAVRTS